ncbi:MAG: NAD(P)/FAD-dependent oxidoreductase [Candidatus Schekmanbacteria bacterium]|nr:NAD(P)/FAD-dependent oxidoreductase [Candidatus Schekmanbacteria bacterium]
MTVAIIGGGLTGLTAAYRLSLSGEKIILFEKDTELGGLAGVVKINDFYLEKYYHHIFTSDTDAVALINDIGLSENLQWLESRMGLYFRKKIYSFGTPVDLLKFKPLSLIDKLRFGLTTLFLKSYSNWQKLENITAVEWMNKYAGRNVCKVIWEPLLVAKFGKNYDKISMTWLWGKIKLRGNSRSDKDNRERLGYLMGSFGLLINKLGEEIENNGGKIFKGAPVQKLDQGENGKWIISSKGGTYEADKVLLTVAPAEILNLYSGFPEDYRRKIGNIDYASTVCMILILNRSFTYNYWENISDNKIPFGGVIEHTNFIHPSHYNNLNILYISNYLYKDESLYNIPDKELLEEYINHLKEMNPEFSQDWIIDYHVFRDEFAQPIMKLNYSKMIPDIKTPAKNLFIANMAQIYPEDRGMNYAVRLAGEAVKIILKG